MYDNTIYDLMEQAVEESQSLWRIKNHYISDAEDCQECKEFWEKLRDDKEQHCKDLWELIEAHIKEGKNQGYKESEQTTV